MRGLGPKTEWHPDIIYGPDFSPSGNDPYKGKPQHNPVPYVESKLEYIYTCMYYKTPVTTLNGEVVGYNTAINNTLKKLQNSLNDDEIKDFKNNIKKRIYKKENEKPKKEKKHLKELQKNWKKDANKMQKKCKNNKKKNNKKKK